MSTDRAEDSLGTGSADGGGELPAGPLVAWYGDDFTGAAATMEVLAFAGLPAMLFLEPPTPEQLERFPGLRAIGVASTARAQSPDWMRRELPGILAALAGLRPALLHYKVCSTLDSSPETGSIGCAIEIGADLAGARIVPVLVAAPQMRRYQAFGQLFAGHGEAVYRLDRHPVMARHPVTPMSEADVGRHIARQSGRIRPHALTLEAMATGPASLAPSPVADGDAIEIVTLDSTDAASEATAGRLIWQGHTTAPFVVGSQGVEFALVRHWREAGVLAPARETAGIGRSDRMVSVSGSVSPTTADQIAWSKANGFAAIPFDATAACRDADILAGEEERAVTAALAALSQGQSPLIHTAEGPDDPAVARLRALVAETGADMGAVNEAIGAALGRILRTALARTGTRRAVISGGDTSGHATRQLGVFALSVLAPTIPGASIFRAHADGPMDGLELALKGGQMGSPDYFGWVRAGGGPR